MKKFHKIILIVTLGFFLIPSVSFSCEMKSEKSCCSTEKSSKETSKDCCKKNKDSQNNDQKGDCNGKCGHNNCTTSSIQFNLAFFDIAFKNNNFDYSVIKQNFIHSEANILSGFSSIWLIPKIG